MQALYAENFDREFDCSEKQWLSILPDAMGANPYQRVANALSARIGAGQLTLSWRNGDPAPVTRPQTPVLFVSFRFSGLQEAERYTFMKRFDMCMQRVGA